MNEACEAFEMQNFPVESFFIEINFLVEVLFFLMEEEGPWNLCSLFTSLIEFSLWGGSSSFNA